MNRIPIFHNRLIGLVTLTLLTASVQSCDLDNGLVPHGIGSDGTTMMASIVAVDGSQPSMEGLSHVDGTVTFEDLDVELWNGSSWLPVVDRLTEATLTVGDVAAETALLSASEIPAGDYSRIRLSAARGTAALSLTVDGQRYGTDAALGDGPIVLDKAIEISDEGGVRTFRVALETIENLTRHTEADGTVSVLMAGDLGHSSLPLTAVVASDGSAPAIDGLAKLAGKLSLEGITLALGDGTTWTTVVEDLEGASFAIGEILSPTPLLKGRDIPSGNYTHAQLSVRRASAALRLEIGDRQFRGEVLLGEDVVVEKALEALDLHGAQLYWLVLETVKTVSEQTAADGSISMLIEGDLGSATLSSKPDEEPAHTAVVASDGSDPQIDGLTELEGKVALHGIKLELGNGTDWRTVVEYRDGARLVVGEVREGTVLLKSDDLPAGNFSHARLSVRRVTAALAVVLGDHVFAGEAVLSENAVFEKELELVRREEHNGSILWMVFEAVETITRQAADDGSLSLLIEGEFGAATLPERRADDRIHTAIVASDGSEPEIDALEHLEGKVVLEGVSLALSDGTSWQTVMEHDDDVRLHVGESRQATVLLRTDELPNAPFSRAQLSVRRATAALALQLGDQWFAGEAVLGEAIVVQKELNQIAEENHDARLLWMVLETVKKVTRQTADDGSISVLVEGDFGDAVLRPVTRPHHGIRFEVIERVHTTGPSPIHEQLRAVIDNADEWERFWNEFTANVTPQPERPQISFDEHMVIVAAMGERNTGGYAIHIEEIVEKEDGIVVRVLEISPGADCAVTSAVTAPVTAVVMPRVDRPIEFAEESDTKSCS